MKVGREYVGRGSSLKGGRTRKDNGREKRQIHLCMT